MSETTSQTSFVYDKRQYVFIKKARCPSCGSGNLLTNRSTQNGDDTVTRHTVCGSCGKRFFVVVE